MLDLSEMLLASEEQDREGQAKAQCQGLFYRYHTSAYKTKNGFATTQSITKLKRLSCKGCNWCDPTEDIIETDLADMNEFPIILPNLIRDGDIIEPYFVPGRTDWETGYIEDWEIHARIVTKEK